MDTVTMAKNAQMDLLIELDRICRKHNISYFLIGGTLIGAIRHGGFIPWDDDIDVGMLWEDYEKFHKACATDLDSAYFLHDWISDPASPHPFFKLKIRGTHYPEGLASNSNMNDSIYIDIFPYNNAPNSPFLRKVQAAQVYLLRKILLLRCDFDLSGNSALRKVLYGALKFASCIFSVNHWKKILTNVQHRYNSSPTEISVNMGGAYSYMRESQPRALLEKTTMHKFENGEFSIPENYDAFLRSCYGDYMQLPPEDQRIGKHEILNIDFGDYQIRYNADYRTENTN